MPDESSPTSPDTPPPYNPARRVGSGLAGETTRNDGSIILPDPNPRPLEVIGDFEVMSKLGQGGMGAVYRARQISLDREVALKILPSNFESDAAHVSRFQREARVASSLHHANLVKVYASGQADGCHYIAMELVAGETLGQWVKRGALPPLEALRITLDVARALECGWRTAQLIHRDVKPGNIFLSEEGAVKLGDLGLAKIVGTDSTGLTHTGAAMGTPHYISPEQARGDKDLDFRTDIYSLGCTLYHMLTRQTPYEGHEPVVVLHQHINAPPPAILKVMPQCPLPLARLVSKMLKKQRRERHASYDDLIAAIESVHAQLDPSYTAPTIPARATPEPVTPAVPLPPPPAAPAKSKLPIYGGIGVVVLAVAAFFLWPKEEKLTTAQRYARDHVSERKDQVNTEPGETRAEAPASAGLAEAHPSDTPAHASATGTYPQPPTWTDATAAFRTKNLTNGALEADGDWLKLKAAGDRTFSVGSGLSIRNPILRVLFSGRAYLSLRRVSNDGQDLRYSGGIGHGDAGISLLAATKSKLALEKLDSDINLDGEHEAVFAAQGDALTLWLDGRVVATAHDNTLSAGSLAVMLTNGSSLGDGRIKKLEYGELPDTAPAAAHLPPSAEPWQDVLHDATKLPLSGGAERTPQGLRFTDFGTAMLRPSQTPKRDGAVRMRAIFGGLRPALKVRASLPGGTYQLFAKDEKTIQLFRWDELPKQATVLREFPLREPFQPGQDYELELRVVGQTLTAKLNGEVLGTVTDATYSQGGFGIGVNDHKSVHDGAPTLVKALEVLDLDAPGGAGSPLATATKEVPFVNTLGQEYVPVPGTQVLFCRRDTRTKDYAVYATLNKVDSTWNHSQKDGVYVSTEPEYPVVGVNWDDAKAFCKWLTETESAEGRLPKGMQYRLPTDEEWSRAAGLSKEEGATPKERSQRDRTYPWGLGFPPTKAKLGNYADAAWHDAFPKEKWIEGYADGYATTSPVGSFPPNQYGLYDMGGNVWQWCEDLTEPGSTDRVLRGASWTDSDPRFMRLSSRNLSAPRNRFSSYGFRCVVGASAR